MAYKAGDTRIMYEVRVGNWDESIWDEEVFETMADARRRYDEIDVRKMFIREYITAAVKRSVRDYDKVLAAYVYRYDGETWEPWEQPLDDIIESDSYGFEVFDEVVRNWVDAGWYCIGWSGSGETWEPVWLEYMSDLEAMVKSAYRSSSEYNLPYVEFLGAGDEPDGWPGFEQAPAI